MPNARDAKEWAAAGGLHGIGNSLYTPFSGRDGDDIDFDAYRALVRYCVGDLGHSMLWLTSGIAEWWSLTVDERKQLVEVAIEEARAIAPATVIQACTSATSAKDCVELTQHAEAAGADICYLQTPPMEVHGGEGVLRFFQYVAERTDIALGMFNSPSSGYVLTPEDSARIANEVPAVCATKEGTLEYWRSKATHALAPSLVIWECDTIVYRVGWLEQGIVGPAQLGTAGYLHETPDKPILTAYWNLIWEGRIAEAIEHARATSLDRIVEGVAHWYVRYPGRPDYFTHWGEAFRCAAATLGLPMGNYPHSRPPQAILPDAAKQEIRSLYESVGFTKQLAQRVAVDPKSRLNRGGRGDTRSVTVSDEELHQLSERELVEEVIRLREGIRRHRDSTAQELCWHHPQLWGLLPESSDPIPDVPAWSQFLRGCVRYRESLDDQLPTAPRVTTEYDV